ncbi:MAG: DUF3786 domain-containing protein [Anaerolineales bacterium]
MKRPNFLADRVEELRVELRGRETAVLARSTGATFTATGPGQGDFRLSMWGRDLILTWPDFVGGTIPNSEPLDGLSQAILAYYFHISDGTPMAGEWIAFTELPDGQFYTAAFQGYTGNELAKAFGNDLDSFVRAAEQLGGRRETLGDAAFAFQVLPRVAMLVVGWQGDEDFAPSYRVLFDTAVSHHLSTDACAMLGSILTRRLIKNR